MEQDYEQEFTRKEARRKRGVLEAVWGKIKDIGDEIPCKWTTEPKSGEAAVFETVIDGTTEQLVVEPDIRFGERTDKRPLSQYKGVAEKWALWKWHTARGTPVTEHDAYQPEPSYKAPTFVWEEAEKRGPGRPRAA